MGFSRSFLEKTDTPFFVFKSKIIKREQKNSGSFSLFRVGIIERNKERSVLTLAASGCRLLWLEHWLLLVLTKNDFAFIDNGVVHRLLDVSDKLTVL